MDSAFWDIASWREPLNQTLFENLEEDLNLSGITKCYNYDAIPLGDVKEYPFLGYKPEITVTLTERGL